MVSIFKLEGVTGTYSSHSIALQEKKKFSEAFPDYKYRIEKTGNQDFPYRLVYTLKKGHTESASEKRLNALEKL